MACFQNEFAPTNKLFEVSQPVDHFPTLLKLILFIPIRVCSPRTIPRHCQPLDRHASKCRRKQHYLMGMVKMLGYASISTVYQMRGRIQMREGRVRRAACPFRSTRAFVTS